jgi:hypothetical protein
MTEDDFTGMFELFDALEAVIKAADPAKREVLAQTIDAYHDCCPDEFHWAIGAQSPMPPLSTHDVRRCGMSPGGTIETTRDHPAC